MWVYLQIEIIWDTCFTDKEIRSTLQSLPKDLEETYRRCIDRINVHDARTIQALTWVNFAKRPLHIGELREAVAFDLHDKKWENEQLPRTDFILGSCANLVTMDPTDYSIHFAHSSVKQYLEKDSALLRGYPSNPVMGDLHCGEICIVYLSFSDFSLGLDRWQDMRASVKVPGPLSIAQQALGLRFIKPSMGNEMRMPLNIIRTSSKPDEMKYKFLSYAIDNWALHTRAISDQSPVWNRFQRLATSFNQTWNFHPWEPSGRSLLSHIHSIFGWAVKEQHEPLLRIVSPYKRELQLVCNLPLSSDSLPALHVACKLGYQEILRFLLKICDINLTDGEGHTALHHASAKGHTGIVQILVLAKGIKLDTRSQSGRTPLWLAASHGHVEVLAILVDNKADVDIPDVQHRTPLSQATENGHLEAVKFLCLAGANIEYEDGNGDNPIDLAFAQRDFELAEFLIRQGAKISADIGSRFLLEASMLGEIDLVERLVATKPLNVNTEATDDERRTSLSWAAGNGHETVVKLLLWKGAVVESHDINGLTPIHWASSNGHDSVLTLLLDSMVKDMFRPGSSPKAPQMEGHMMNVNPQNKLGEWGYYVLDKRSLIVYETPEATSHGIVMDSLRLEHSTVTSVTTSDLLDQTVTRATGGEKLCMDEPNTRLCYFSLTFGRTGETMNSNSVIQYYFAVRSEQERIDWMRQLMLFNAWRGAMFVRNSRRTMVVMSVNPFTP